MDRKAYIIVTLCVLGLIYTSFFMPKPPAPAPVEPAPTVTSTDPAAPETTGSNITGAPAPDASTAVTPSISAPPAGVEETTLTNDRVEATFTNLGGGIRFVRLLDQQESKSGGNVILNSVGRAPIGSLGSGPDSLGNDVVFAVSESTDSSVTYEATTPAGLSIKKKYTLRKPQENGIPVTQSDGYLIDLELTLTNSAATPANTSALYLYSGAINPLLKRERVPPSFGWNTGGEADSKSANSFGQSGFLFMKFGEDRRTIDIASDDLLWAGTFNQFFCTLITPEEHGAGTVWGRRLPAPLPPGEQDDKQHYACEAAFSLPPATLESGTPLTQHFQIYAGPRSYAGLKQLGTQREDMLFYGMFNIICVTLMKLMLWFYSIVGNFGVAVLLVTLTIRILIWPLYAKSQKSMKRMAALSPKMKAIQAKYKDDPQKQQQKVMALYKDYGVNPIGGCLPMLLQMPIFFGFYTMLQSAVELRGADFLWVHDLSAPDTVAHIAGLPINPLPLLMAGTMLLQMMMTPNTGDKMQQRMFMIMPVFFLFICYSFASALALYWTAQNIIGIFQTWLTKRGPDVELVKKERPAKAKRALPGAPDKPKKPQGPRTGGAGKSARKKGGS